VHARRKIACRSSEINVHVPSRSSRDLINVSINAARMSRCGFIPPSGPPDLPDLATPRSPQTDDRSKIPETVSFAMTRSASGDNRSLQSGNGEPRLARGIKTKESLMQMDAALTFPSQESPRFLQIRGRVSCDFSRNRFISSCPRYKDVGNLFPR